MADVNGDGWLDIYVCNSGDIKGDNKQNELYINKGDGTFTEQAEAYGLADAGYSTHAAFFDYDRDGDLDCYLLNNSYQAIGSFNLRKNVRPVRDSVGGDKLFRNDGNVFTDVSEAAGIYGSIIGFGLGVTVGDVNNDGWQDIYVSNDFFERDYLYMNQGDGTFRESLEDQMQSISGASMGADMADINNDGAPDIFVTEMLPESEDRLKTKTTYENWDRYQYNLQNGYYHQFTRNMLQLNQGVNSNPTNPVPATGGNIPTFAEIGRLAQVEATDWSWGALIFDMDNDGWRDIFVANGIYQDLTDQDYLNFIANEETQKAIITKQGVNFKALIDSIPSNPVPNHAFQNQGNLRFVNKAYDWGLDAISFSNGSAYGDLDNDGDLDLVVNNVNMPAFVYRNYSRERRPENHYLQFDLKGNAPNTFAFGAKIFMQHEGKMWYAEQMPVRGFESSVDPRPLIGLGDLEKIDTVLVRWPDQTETLLTNVTVDKTVLIRQSENAGPNTGLFNPASGASPMLQDWTASSGIDFIHKENAFVDFDRDRLIYHMLSTEGPKIAVGDVNGDQLDDFYIGGAKEQAGQLWIQESGGKFRPGNNEVFAADAASEDMDALFFDADKDGDLDLYVASGGHEFSNTSSPLLDRLYFNDGTGRFKKSKQALPSTQYESSSCVRAADFDADGDLDLAVGIRVKPFDYGLACKVYLLANNGNGEFADVTPEWAPELESAGMITDLAFMDYDGDQKPDLLCVGEWMPPRLWHNEGKTFKEVTQQARLDGFTGWWHCLRAVDLDGDGDMDFAAGNLGLNARFRASEDKPVSMYVKDFDKNGSIEQILCQYNGEKSYPMVLRHDLIQQIPSLKKRFVRYDQYKGRTIQDIFSPSELEGSLYLTAKEMSSGSFINNGDGTFLFEAFPVAAQMSPVYGLAASDVDGDKRPDLLLGGNLYSVKPEVGRYDASNGLLLQNLGMDAWEALPARQSGFYESGEIRDIENIQVNGAPAVLVSRSNGRLVLLGWGLRAN